MIDEHTRLAAVMRANEDATIRRMAGAGYSDAEIAKYLRRDDDAGRQHVGRRRRELQIKPGQPPKLRAMMARLHLRRLCGRVAA